MQISLPNGPIFRGLDFVVAIMPEASGSSKAQADEAAARFSA
jgi:hypothetical protein